MLESPEYEAVIIVAPRLAPFTLRLQLDAERVQVVPSANEIESVVCDHVIVSPFVEATVPVKVTVQIADSSIVKGLGEQDKDATLMAF